MKHIEWWAYVTAVCTALLAVLAVYRKVVKPVLRAIWRTIKRLNTMSDAFLGDREKGIPSLPERIAALEEAHATLANKLEEHQRWHAATGRTNGIREQQPKR